MRHSLTDRLFGYTMLRELEIHIDASSGACELSFLLYRDCDESAPPVRVRCTDAQKIKIDIGGPTSQFLCLVVEDISQDQLDRVNYSVRELEEEAISFVCRAIELEM